MLHHTSICCSRWFLSLPIWQPVALIVCATLEFGFELSAQLRHEFAWLYFCVWITFLVDRISHLILKKSAYSFWGWGVNALLALTLLPIIVKVLGIDDSTGVMSVLDNRVFHLLVLFVISVIDLSDAMMSSLGKKSNPALMMAVSFLFIILVGSGLLLMPRCVHHGVHLSWVDSLFTATSAVCVTGLTTIDVPTTFTVFGQMVIMLLIQIGGLGVMTITSFFALFFMGNASIYNQMLVRDMVSSKSLASLWSTLLNIFGFTAFIELAGACGYLLQYSWYDWAQPRPGTVLQPLPFRIGLLQWRLLHLSQWIECTRIDGASLLALYHHRATYHSRRYWLPCAREFQDGCL